MKNNFGKSFAAAKASQFFCKSFAFELNRFALTVKKTGREERRKKSGEAMTGAKRFSSKAKLLQKKAGEAMTGAKRFSSKAKLLQKKAGEAMTGAKRFSSKAKLLQKRAGEAMTGAKRFSSKAKLLQKRAGLSKPESVFT